MPRILLVRHGQSTWNAEGRWQGRADPPLTERGEDQAREAARSLGFFDALVTSPLRRAHRTAEILGDELGLGPVEVMPELIERAVGPWSGLTFEEIEGGWPGALDRRDWPEGFEDDDTLLARALSAIDRLAARFPEGDILAVTHGGVLHALERHAALVRGRFPNLSGRWVTMTGGRVHLGDRLDLVAEPTGGRPRALQGTTGAGPHPAVEPA